MLKHLGGILLAPVVFALHYWFKFVCGESTRVLAFIRRDTHSTLAPIARMFLLRKDILV